MRFRVGRVFLVGDAAARLSPAGGLGLNTGLQSSHNLAWKLAAVVRGEASEVLLDSYEAERHSAALANDGKYQRTTRSKSTRSFRRVFAEKRIVFASLVAHSRRAGAGLGQDLGVVYESGAFVSDGTKPPKVADTINDYIPSACPGCRAPHVWIERNEGKRSILDLFEGTMVLLAGRKGDIWPEPPSDRSCAIMRTLFAKSSRRSTESGKPAPCWSDPTDTSARVSSPLPRIRRVPCMRPSTGFSPNRSSEGRVRAESKSRAG